MERQLLSPSCRAHALPAGLTSAPGRAGTLLCPGARAAW